MVLDVGWMPGKGVLPALKISQQVTPNDHYIKCKYHAHPDADRATPPLCWGLVHGCNWSMQFPARW